MTSHGSHRPSRLFRLLLLRQTVLYKKRHGLLDLVAGTSAACRSFDPDKPKQVFPGWRHCLAICPWMCTALRLMSGQFRFYPLANKGRACWSCTWSRHSPREIPMPVMLYGWNHGHWSNWDFTCFGRPSSLNTRVLRGCWYSMIYCPAAPSALLHRQPIQQHDAHVLKKSTLFPDDDSAHRVILVLLRPITVAHHHSTPSAQKRYLQREQGITGKEEEKKTIWCRVLNLFGRLRVDRKMGFMGSCWWWCATFLAFEPLKPRLIFDVLFCHSPWFCKWRLVKGLGTQC